MSDDVRAAVRRAMVDRIAELPRNAQAETPFPPRPARAWTTDYADGYRAALARAEQIARAYAHEQQPAECLAAVGRFRASIEIADRIAKEASQ